MQQNQQQTGGVNLKLRLSFGHQPELIDALCVYLEQEGFVYDTDYTAIYGESWTLCGVEFEGPRIAEVNRAAMVWLTNRAVVMGLIVAGQELRSKEIT